MVKTEAWLSKRLASMVKRLKALLSKWPIDGVWLVSVGSVFQVPIDIILLTFSY